MDIKKHTYPDKLERCSFIWSEARLIIAAAALFLGGIPPVIKFLPILQFYGLASSLLTLAWIISGLAAGYLLYRWYNAQQTVFGGKDMKDTAAFFVMVVSGLNLGIAGLLGTNIGMRISMNKVVFIIVGLLYLVAAYHLYTRFKARGEKVF